MQIKHEWINGTTATIEVFAEDGRQIYAANGHDLADREQCDAIGQAISREVNGHSGTISDELYACGMDRQRELLRMGTPDSMPFRPFPVDTLPAPFKSLVYDGAESLGCDASLIALPLLSAMAAAIGNSRVIRVTDTWVLPACLWTCVVGESGTSKTPAMDLATKATGERQSLALQQYKSQHETWKQEHSGSKKQGRPDAPTPVRYIIQDTTVEALFDRLQASPRGLLLTSDEMAEWFGSFDRYASSGGADASKWNKLWNCGSISVDRKNADQPLIYIPLANVSICGGVQPGPLGRCLAGQNTESGLAARLLMAMPPRRRLQFNPESVCIDSLAHCRQAFERLYTLEMQVTPYGAPKPVEIGLDDEAKAAIYDYLNWQAGELASAEGGDAAMLSKMRSYVCRLALVIHLGRVAGGEDLPDEIDAQTLNGAIELAEWFTYEARRISVMLAESKDEKQTRTSVEAIKRAGGAMTVRKWQQSNRRLRTADDARQDLQILVDIGQARWEEVPSPSGNRSTTRLVLIDPQRNNGREEQTGEPCQMVQPDQSHEFHEPDGHMRLAA